MQIRELSLKNNRENVRVFIANSDSFFNSFNILKKTLFEFFYLDISEDDLYYGKNGKPYLKDKSLFFNISHSGKYTVIALSKDELGVDIQLIKRKSNWSDLFNKRDNSLVNRISENENIGYSILWSCKEAYLKKIGVGLSVDYSTVQFDSLDSPIYYKNNTIYWNTFEICEEIYSIAICVKE